MNDPLLKIWLQILKNIEFMVFILISKCSQNEKQTYYLFLCIKYNQYGNNGCEVFKGGMQN